MYDPGGKSEEADGGDWCFRRENERWNEMQRGRGKAHGEWGWVKAGEEGEWSDEGAEEGEQNGYKKKVEGELACRSGLQEQRATVELKDTEQGGTRKLKVLGITALMRNKAQLFPTTRRPETSNLTPEDEVSASRVEKWFASTALQLGSCLADRERERAKRLLYT